MTVEMIGRRFGRFIVKSIHHSGSGGKLYWNVVCDCGNEGVVEGWNLRYGNTKSCGCGPQGRKRVEKKKTGMPKSLLDPREKGIRKVIGKYRVNAKIRGFSWKLSDEQARELVLSKCHYCGRGAVSNLDVSTKSSGATKFSYIGIDRKDNSQGYTETNTVPCCIVCNRAKMTMGYEDFMAYVNHLILFRRQ